MKNKFIYFITLLFFNLLISNAHAEELSISANTVEFDDISKVLILNGDVTAVDEDQNKVFASRARYNKKENLFETFGKTTIITNSGYNIEGENILFDNKLKKISSKSNTVIVDLEKNKISVDMFDYLIKKKFFFSKGEISIIDKNKNILKFSEIYIDESKNKIIGTDAKVLLNQKDLKIDDRNNPRFFANSFDSNKDISNFQKGVFTYCKLNKNEKCPPWVIQSDKITHNKTTKTIYYEKAVVKVYDFPIFYFPKFNHPDPSVKRRSGFLAPTSTTNSTMGAGFQLPYYWAFADDKDITFSPKLYSKQHPLYLAEYRQDFSNSYLIFDGGYTKGYKNTNTIRTPGSRSHLFAKFNSNFIDENNKKDNFELNLQHVSNDTHFKIHDIDTALVEKESNILDNNVSYDYFDENLYFSINANSFEDLNVKGNERYEYLLPYANLDKNLFANEKFGLLGLSSTLQIRNYDVDKQTEFFVNDFSWESNKWINNLGTENQFQGLFKTVNYNASNANEYKTEETQTQFSGAVGYLSELGLYKNEKLNGFSKFFTPKLFVRYSPGHMRKITEGKLDHSNLFDINKVSDIDVLENGLSSTFGFDYKINKLNSNNKIDYEKFSLTTGLVHNFEKNSDLPSSSSLNKKTSDLVGDLEYNINRNLKMSYNYSVENNFKESNYNDVGMELSLNDTKFNINYLEKKNQFGHEESVSSGLDFKIKDSAELSFSTKRNLVTSSAEFYSMSYNYINDCLKAGLLFRREFYSDKDIEPDNSLMFTITLMPLGALSTPKLSQ